MEGRVIVLMIGQNELIVGKEADPSSDPECFELRDAATNTMITDLVPQTGAVRGARAEQVTFLPVGSPLFSILYVDPLFVRKDKVIAYGWVESGDLYKAYMGYVNQYLKHETARIQ